MRLFDRYIAKQIIVGTIYAVFVLSLVLVMGNLFKQARPLLPKGGARTDGLVRHGRLAPVSVRGGAWARGPAGLSAAVHPRAGAAARV